MSDRLHEIMGQIAVLHDELITSGKISSASLVFEHLESSDSDVKEHYLNLLLQYYFQKNDLANLKELLLVGARFDMNFSDVKDAFLEIKSNSENVIEFMKDSIVFIKDTNLQEPLVKMFAYYNNSENIKVYLEEAIEIIKRNRYVCTYCYKNKDKEFAQFFLNEDLLQSLKRDLPHLLK